MKLNVKVAPGLIERTSKVNTATSVVILVRIGSDPENLDTTVRITFTKEEWERLTK